MDPGSPFSLSHTPSFNRTAVGASLRRNLKVQLAFTRGWRREGTASMRLSFSRPSSTMAKPQEPSGEEREEVVPCYLEALTPE